MVKMMFPVSNFTLIMYLMLISSCFHSKNYQATFTIQNTNPEYNTKDLSVNIINQLAEQNELTKDPKYAGTDTIGYFGRPYHYFKFWVEPTNNPKMIKLDYWGMYSNKKKPPYQDFLNILTDSLRSNFTIIDQNIKETKKGNGQ